MIFLDADAENMETTTSTTTTTTATTTKLKRNSKPKRKKKKKTKSSKKTENLKKVKKEKKRILRKGVHFLDTFPAICCNTLKSYLVLTNILKPIFIPLDTPKSILQKKNTNECIE